MPDTLIPLDQIEAHAAQSQEGGDELVPLDVLAKQIGVIGMSGPAAAPPRQPYTGPASMNEYGLDPAYMGPGWSNGQRSAAGQEIDRERMFDEADRFQAADAPVVVSPEVPQFGESYRPPAPTSMPSTMQQVATASNEVLPTIGNALVPPTHKRFDPKTGQEIRQPLTQDLKNIRSTS
jgi:hypothetical protein